METLALMDKIREWKLPVKSHMASLDDETIDQIKENLKERDKIDSSRKFSPLKKAIDAVEIDTSHLTLNQQIDKIVELAESIIYEG